MVELGRPVVAEWTFPRAAGSVLLMIRFAEDHGVAAADVLRGSALTESALARPDAQLDAHQELAVVRNLVRLLGKRPALGVEVGFRYRVTTFGIFGFACVSSPTVRDMIAFALRYWDLSFAFCIPVVHVDGDEIRWELHDDRVPADVRAFLVQRDMSAMYKVMSDLLSEPIRLRWLELAFPEPPGWPDEAFGVHPTFDAPANLAAVDLNLDQPLPQGDEHTVALCEAQCRDLVARNRARTGVAREVRDRLIKVGGAATMDEVARALALSPRTLRRKLDDAGTSYRALLDEVRETLAEEMLATGALSVHDVALRLGYAEASSFIYAFKRWKGTTPAAFLRR
ncbi:Helix-turn-helix domain-containing protein [Actinokineospora alba]|uniref:Helix-turn-helix domain-containing protein n=1 Tax=Actinokineospora alba TaxID=504798 RepID=A0A1H0ENF5_9PSEU|nr:AraC family transcriptional regulator [Actinokineospora alba]TDP69151.1 helix-turn-helix protein [Actinokineospora alba]SDI23223.1 Helix-turn-helix domain-containing protein [Actinokineospora alba]SDN83880.1 Helix-turn-helix domain-containing protein [Actinokineospora alba]